MNQFLGSVRTHFSGKKNEMTIILICRLLNVICVLRVNFVMHLHRSQFVR